MKNTINSSPATIKQSIEEFKNHLLEKEKSVNTIKSYALDINHFLQWIELRIEPPYMISSLTSIDLKDYVSQLKSDSSLAPTTINRKVVSLIRWSEFLVNVGSTNINLAAGIKLKKVQKQNNIRWLTRREVGKLLHTVELTKQQNFKKGILHQTIIYLAVNLGLRVKEICNIKISDIDTERGILEVNGKGNKHRTIPLTENTREIIDIWLRERDRESQYLLVSSKSNRMSTRAVQHIFKNYSNQLGIQITPHTLRHTYCKQLAEAGVSIQSIAELAGHSSVETTRVYVTPSIRELQEAMKKVEF